MFFVFNKEKIICYIIAFSTVAFLIGISSFVKPNMQNIQTMYSVTNNQNIAEFNENSIVD